MILTSHYCISKLRKPPTVTALLGIVVLLKQPLTYHQPRLGPVAAAAGGT